MAEINEMCTSKGNEKVAFVREKLNKVISDFEKVKEERKIPQKPKIQRVPMILARDERHHEKYYEPRWVSIGPIHHGKQKLRLAEDRYKLKLVGKFIHDGGQKSGYEDLYEKIKGELEALKQCFDEEAIKGYDDEELGWMLFFDGCFVLQFIDSYIHGQLKMLFEVKKDQTALARQDLFLLENQIPFRVLELLIDGSNAIGEKLKKSINEFVRMCLMTPDRQSKAAEMGWPREDQPSPAHLLDLLRMALLRQSGEGLPEKQIKSTTTADHHPSLFDPLNETSERERDIEAPEHRDYGGSGSDSGKDEHQEGHSHFTSGGIHPVRGAEPEIEAREHRDYGGSGSDSGKDEHEVDHSHVTLGGIHPVREAETPGSSTIRQSGEGRSLGVHLCQRRFRKTSESDPDFELLEDGVVVRYASGLAFAESYIEADRGAETPGRVKTNDDYKDYQQSFRSVQDLKAAGIILKPSKSRCLRDIKYSSVWFFAGKLELPTLIVDDSTAPKLLNLIAYEMCPDNTETEYEITSYVSFLDSLIDYPSDVKELRSAHILRNLLGCDKEVAQLFNEIGKDIVPNNEVYKKVILQIEKHYNNKCMTWVAQVLDDHFSSPWTVAAFTAAILALALTATQAWFTINPQPGPCDRYCAKNL